MTQIVGAIGIISDLNIEVKLQSVVRIELEAYWNRYLCLAFMLASSLFMSAQNQNPKINFTNITTADGLSNNFVNDIIEDSIGFIWVGTTDGLCRYDSKDDFKVYQEGGEIDLKSNNIRSLLSGSNNTIWIGTRLGGLTCYNQSTQTSQNYLHDPSDPNSISNNEILNIFEDSKGRLWIGTEFGLNLYNPTDNNFYSWLPDENNSSSLSKRAILTIKEDSRGFIWVGSWTGGLSLILNSDSEDLSEISFRNFEIDESIAANNVWTITEDHKQRLWIGTHGGGLFVVKLPSNASNHKKEQNWSLLTKNFSEENSPSLRSNTIDHIYQDYKNNIWLATTIGLHLLTSDQVDKEIIDQTKFNFTNYKYENSAKNSMIGTVINKVITDKENNFWVGGINGMSKFNINEKQIENFPMVIAQDLNHLNNNFYIQDDDTAWIAGEIKGLHKYDFRNKTLTNIALDGLPSEIKLMSITAQKGTLFIGTNLGVVTVDINTKKTKLYKAPQEITLNTNSIFLRYIFVDDTGLIYLSTEYGLVTLNRKNQKFKHYKNIPHDPTTLSDNSLNKITQTSDGGIWIATYNGLNKVVGTNKNNLKFKSYINKANDTENNLGSNQIITLEESSGALYIGTTYGINKLDLETDEISTLNDHSSKAYVLSIESDKIGNIWYSTSEGISKYNIKAQSLRNYDSNDGITDNTFRLITSAATDNYIFFGSNKGISRVNISNDYKIKKAPRTHITEANLINKDGAKEFNLIGVDEITLPANNYYLALKFTGLDYERMDKTQFAYKLEGFDEEWFYPKKNMPAVYTNLKPGDYIFKSKTANNEGNWSEQIAELKITKKPFLTQRPWIKFLIVLLILFLLLAAISTYTSNIMKNNQRLQSYNDNLNKEIRERKKIEEDLMQTNMDLKQFSYGASHDLQEPLRNIGNAVGLLKRTNNFNEKSEEFVEIAVDGVKRMSLLIENILIFAKTGSKSIVVQSADLNKIVGEKITDLSQLIASKNTEVIADDLPNINCEVNQIGVVFYNLINNAIKFNKSENPIVKIGFKEEKKFWIFSVEDNGIGIAEKYQNKIFSIFTRLENKREYEGTGIGLSLCQKIVARHNGKIWIKSSKGKGAIFYFSIDKNLVSQEEQE